MESEYGLALLYLLGGLVFVIVIGLTNRLLSVRKPNPEKLSTYECGEEPIGTSWVQFNMRFYTMGLAFLVFDVELLLLYPWAVAFTDPAHLAADPLWGRVALAEATAFIAILALGLAYIWQRGDIDWARPQPLPPAVDQPVPLDRYAEWNKGR